MQKIMTNDNFLKPVLLTVLIVISACTNARNTTVGDQEITGQVVDIRTAKPVAAALVIFTLPKGSRWNLPSSFLLGYTFTEADGTFRLPPNPTSVKELRRSDASITIDAYHPQYKQGVGFARRSKQTIDVKIELQKKSALQTTELECTYNNPEICEIVNNYFDR